MSENKRPLADFSQGNDRYREPVYGYTPEESGSEATAPKLPPSALFSNNSFTTLPKTPGTFATSKPGRAGGEIMNPQAELRSLEKKKIENRKSEVLKHIIAVRERKNALFNTLEIVRSEYSQANTDQAAKEFTLEIDELESNILSAASLSVLEELALKITSIDQNLMDLKSDVDTTIANKINQVERLQELLPARSRYSILESRAVELSKKVTSDTSTRLLSLFSPLAWLTKGVSESKNMSLEDVLIQLSEIEDEITKEESKLHEKDTLEKKKSEETINLLQQFAPLAVSFAELKKDAESLLVKIDDNDEKQTITNIVSHINETAQQFTENPNRENLESLKNELKEFESYIETLSEQLETPSIPLQDVYRLWEINTSELKGAKEHTATDKEFWTTEKVKGFDRIYKAYVQFIEKENRIRKIKEFPELIKAKNDVLEALKTGSLHHVINAREKFEEALTESTASWEKIKSEEKSSSLKKEEVTQKRDVENNKRKEIKENFTHITAQKEELFLILGDMLARIHSPLEKEMLLRKKARIEEESLAISKLIETGSTENLEPLMAQYDKDLMSLRDILDSIDARLLQVESSQKINKKDMPASIFSRSRSAPVDKSKQFIRLRDGRNITVEAWRKENESKPKTSEEEENIQKDREKEATKNAYDAHGPAINAAKEQYEKILSRNPVDVFDPKQLTAFNEAYFNKDWSQDPAGKQAYKEMFFESLRKEKEERENEEADLERNQREFTITPEEEVRLKEVGILISQLNNEISSISSLPYAKQMDRYKAAHHARTSLHNSRQTYSPMEDPSTNHIPIKRTVAIPHEEAAYATAMTERQEEADAKGLDKLTEEQVMVETKDSLIPNKFREGRKLTAEEIEAKNNLKPEEVEALITKSPSHYRGMITAEGKGEVSMAQSTEQIKEEEAHARAQEQTPEQKATMKEWVSRIFGPLIKNREAVSGKNWRALIVPVILAGAAGFMGTTRALSDIEKMEKKPTTLGQVMSWEWRNYPKSPEEQLFYARIKGKGPADFTQFIRETAPSVPTDEKTNAPETLSQLKCRDIFSAPSLPGFNDDIQRRQLSEVVENLYQLKQHTDPNYKKVKLTTDMLTTSLTLEQLYAETLTAIATADARIAKEKKMI